MFDGIHSEAVMFDERSAERTSYTQDDVDALAYSYVLTYGYERSLAMFAELMASGDRRNGDADDLLALCRQIADAIDDESATIFRLLDRMAASLRNGAHHSIAAIPLTRPNPIDRHVGDRVRQRRRELGLSLISVAAESALTLDELALIEDGAERLAPVALDRLARRLRVPAAYFFRNPRSDESAISAKRTLKR